MTFRLLVIFANSYLHKLGSPSSVLSSSEDSDDEDDDDDDDDDDD